MEIAIKHKAGNVTNVKEINRDGIPIGIIEGYIATWDIDRCDDEFVKGCFSEHLAELKAQDRQVRLKDHHGRTVGGFPIESVIEDARGLFGIGEVNLEVQQGKEMYSLAKQKVLTDFSIGYSIQEVEWENGIRRIMKSKVWEGSVVDEPMNPNANITDVKSMDVRKLLPKEFADFSYRWEPQKALERIEASGENLVIDIENYCDIVDGTLKIIPRALFSDRLFLSSAKCPLPEEAKSYAKGILNILYKEMGLKPPFIDGKIKSFCLTEIKNLTKSDFCNSVQNYKLSRDAANYITSKAFPAIMGELSNEEDLGVLNDLLQDLKNTRGNING